MFGAQNAFGISVAFMMYRHGAAAAAGSRANHSRAMVIDVFKIMSSLRGLCGEGRLDGRESSCNTRPHFEDSLSGCTRGEPGDANTAQSIKSCIN